MTITVTFSSENWDVWLLTFTRNKRNTALTACACKLIGIQRHDVSASKWWHSSTDYCYSVLATFSITPYLCICMMTTVNAATLMHVVFHHQCGRTSLTSLQFARTIFKDVICGQESEPLSYVLCTNTVRQKCVFCLCITLMEQSTTNC